MYEPRGDNQEADLRFERLLAELRELGQAAVWQRVERVLGRVVARCGAGLAETSGPQLAGVIGEDDLIASMIVVHALSIEERVERALSALRSELRVPGAALALIEIRCGVARITVGGDAVSVGAIRRAVAAAAPEITAVEVCGRARA